jgi:hypothetical protein
MLNRLKALFTRPEPQADLPPIVLPKVKGGAQAKQSFSKRTATSTGEQRLTSADRRTANLDLLSLRNGTSTKSTIHDLAQVSPDLSASVYAYQRLVVSKEFKAVARNLDGTINPEATKLTQSLLARFNYLTDYNDGFAGVSSIHTLAEQLCMELRLYGSCAMELVLDKARVPNRLQPLSTTQIEFYEDNTGYIAPHQRVNGVDINLDIPTFFYSALDQDLLSSYSSSPMESALQAILADTEFTNDVRRSIKKALHPRLNVAIDSDKFRKSVPISIAGDSEGVATFQENFISDIETTVNGLEPDDALISFDSVGFTYLNNGNASLSAEWETLQKMIDAKSATGSKAPSFVLGHGSGSQNVASSESLLFLKYCEGLQQHINGMLSRALTLAARLLGQDCYVQFSFDPIDLRPRAELTTFRVMEQSRVLELLSIGLMSDEEASVALTGNLPPAGYKPLSGTFFKAGATDPNAVDTASAQSNTGAMQQTLNSDAPQAPKGPAKNDPAKPQPPKKAEDDAQFEAMERRHVEISSHVIRLAEGAERHQETIAQLVQQQRELERQQYQVVAKRQDRPERDPVLTALAASMAAAREPMSVHVHMPEGLVQMAAAQAPNLQVDVHVPQAAAQPSPNIQVDVHVPQVPAPVVNVSNDIQPAPVTVNNAFSRKAVQTVERDKNDEILSTTTVYSQE